MSVGGKIAGAAISGAPVVVALASVKAAVLAWQTPIVSVAGLGELIGYPPIGLQPQPQGDLSCRKETSIAPVTQFRQPGRVAAPVRHHLHEQFQVDRPINQLDHLLAGAAADLLEHGAALADQDSLLAAALH